MTPEFPVGTVQEEPKLHNKAIALADIASKDGEILAVAVVPAGS